MLVPLLLVFPTALTAFEVPCQKGQTVCDGALSLSVVNNDYHCCSTGFNMQWKSEIVNGTQETNCVCHRYYTETECLEGELICRGATSRTSTGSKVQCCKNGDSMNSVTNAFINGARLNYCKCIKYENGNTNIVNVGGGAWINGRPMTPSEREHFNREMNQFGRDMNQWGQDFSRGMSQWSRDFSRDMSNMFNDMGNQFFSGPNLANIGRWTGDILRNLGLGGRPSSRPPRPSGFPFSGPSRRPFPNPRITELLNPNFWGGFLGGPRAGPKPTNRGTTSTSNNNGVPATGEANNNGVPATGEANNNGVPTTAEVNTSGADNGNNSPVLISP